ncbi:MAG: nitrous oxide reductase accessory protein NosL [Rhodospirillales bacterium]|nr:nitrous oxide reductase accessory protein NosL [Rhodospirillales bacterium]
MCKFHLSRRRFLTVVSPGFVAALSGCFEGASTGPAEVRWGREFCDYCGMIIDNPRFAAQIRGGDPRKLWKFDDVSCGVLWRARQSWENEEKTEFWVGNSATGKWIDGKKAYYLSGMKSPMGYDYGAVAEPKDGALTFEAYRDRVIAGGSRSECVTSSLVRN